MSNFGPVPKRSDELIRRNKTEPVEKLVAVGRVAQPELGFEAHDLIKDFYKSLADSAQAMYYEPSDWHFIRIQLHVLNKQVGAERINGQILATVFAALQEHLVSEGSRRRNRLEIERSSGEDLGKAAEDYLIEVLGLE